MVTVTAPRPEPAATTSLRSAPVKRGRLVPLVALATLTTLVGAGIHLMFRMSIDGSGTTPVRVSGLSLALAIVFLSVPPTLLAVAARTRAWFAHFAAGSITGLALWFALGALSPSLLLAGAAGAAVALPVRYPGHRMLRALVLVGPGVFTWLIVGTGEFGGFGVLTLGLMLGAPLFLVAFDFVTWDGPRLVMRQLGRNKLPDRMDRIEAARFGRQIEWQSWSILGLLLGIALIGLWWAGGRAPYQPASALVPVQIEVTDTWLDVNGSYNVEWERTQNVRGDASTFRMFRAGNRRARLSATNTGNPLVADMYFGSSYGATNSIEVVSLNALGTPTVVRAELLTAERLDCTASNAEGACGELTYTAYLDQYMVEVVVSRPRSLKVGQISPIVDQMLEQLERRIGS